MSAGYTLFTRTISEARWTPEILTCCKQLKPFFETPYPVWIVLRLTVFLKAGVCQGLLGGGGPRNLPGCLGKFPYPCETLILMTTRLSGLWGSQKKSGIPAVDHSALKQAKT